MDKLRSYHVAINSIIQTAEQIDNMRADNRSENSHQPVQRRERRIQRFKSPGSTQYFLNIQSAAYNTFYLHGTNSIERALKFTKPLHLTCGKAQVLRL
jgi:transposase-like protein